MRLLLSVISFCYGLDPNSHGICSAHCDNFVFCWCYHGVILALNSWRSIVDIPIRAPLRVHVDQLLVGLYIVLSSDGVRKNGEQVKSSHSVFEAELRNCSQCSTRNSSIWSPIHLQYNSRSSCPYISTLWKSRYQGANFCQDLETFPRKAWQKFVPWYLLLHNVNQLHRTCKGLLLWC